MASFKRKPSSLRELRDFSQKTQVAVAEAMGVGQSEVSLLEKRESSLDNVRLHTLRRYVEALGGELVVVAMLDDTQMPIDIG